MKAKQQSALFIFEKNREFYSQIFNKLGLDVDAVSYEEATKPFDGMAGFKLIITDIFFNSDFKNGINLIKEIKLTARTQNYDPYIVIFSSGSDMCEEALKELEVNEIILIPTLLDELEKYVSKWQEIIFEN